MDATIGRRTRSVAWTEALGVQLRDYLEIYLDHPRTFISVGAGTSNTVAGVDVVITVTRFATSSDATVARQRLLLLNEDSGVTGARAILTAKLQSPFTFVVEAITASGTTTLTPTVENSSKEVFTGNQFLAVVVCASVVALLLVVVVVSIVSTRSRREASVGVSVEETPEWPGLPELQAITAGTAGGWNTTNHTDDLGSEPAHYYPATDVWDGRQQATVSKSRVGSGMANSRYEWQSRT